MQRRQRHALHGRWMARLGAYPQLAHEPGQIQLRLTSTLLVGKFDKCPQRFPPFARLGSVRLFLRQSQRFQNLPHLFWHRHSRILTAGCALQRHQRLPHLLPREEPFAATHLKRDAGLGQRLLVHLRLCVDAVQHRDLGGGGSGFNQCRNGFRNRLGLCRLVVMLGKPGGRPLWPLTDQLQLAAGHPALRGRDQPIGQRNHLRRRTIVAFQTDHRRIGKSAREAKQVLRSGTGERVDGLVGVAHYRHVIARPQPRVEHPLLQRGHVLVLVDDETAITVPELLGDGCRVLDGGRGMKQQVVEVEKGGPIGPGLEFFVARVDLGHLFGRHRRVPAELGGGGRICLRADQRRLGPLDFTGEVTHGVGGGAHLGAVRGLRDEGELAVDQLPAGIADQLRPEIPELP
ncbi:Uncharacterised protein [Mycobacteroides abscessus subsp. abscessus]|nr:Uncharacterised protein [Mycobacteroides abscessus subsp. abscessus]